MCLCSIKMHEQRKTKQKNDDKTPEGAVPAYLLDREGQSRAKVLSNMIKQKRKEKAVSVGKYLLISCSFSSFFFQGHLSFCDVWCVEILSLFVNSTLIHFCRANGKCLCPRCAHKERQRCLKLSEPERDKRKPGRGWSQKFALWATALPVNLQSMNVSSDRR